MVSSNPRIQIGKAREHVAWGTEPKVRAQMCVLNVLVLKSASANRALNPGSVQVDVNVSLVSASYALPTSGYCGICIVDRLGRVVHLGFDDVSTRLQSLSASSYSRVNLAYKLSEAAQIVSPRPACRTFPDVLSFGIESSKC
jgi:hypothetical protein